jgi:hypothetical protein
MVTINLIIISLEIIKINSTIHIEHITKMGMNYTSLE